MYVGNAHAMMWTQLVTGEIFMETLVSVMKETAKQCMIDIPMTSVQVRNVSKVHLCTFITRASNWPDIPGILGGRLFTLKAIDL